MNQLDTVTPDEMETVEGGMTAQPKPPPDPVAQIIKWVLAHL